MNTNYFRTTPSPKLNKFCFRGFLIVLMNIGTSLFVRNINVNDYTYL